MVRPEKGPVVNSLRKRVHLGEFFHGRNFLPLKWNCLSIDPGILTTVRTTLVGQDWEIKYLFL